MNSLRFAAICVVGYIALPLLALMVERLFGFDITSAAFAIIPPMLAAMIEGQLLARSEGRVPERGEKLRLTAVGTGLGVLVLAGVVLALPRLAALALGLPEGGAEAGLLAGLVTMLVLAVAASIYVFSGLGARNELKAIARRKARKR